MHPAALLLRCLPLRGTPYSRSFTNGMQTISAERVATYSNHHDIVAWLVSSRQWSTPLHHLTILTAARARALLRAGADLHARSRGRPDAALARAGQACGRRDA